MTTPKATAGAPSPWRDPVALLAVPAVIYLLAVYAFPLLLLLMKSFTGPGGLTVQPYIAVLGDPFNWRVVGNTLRVALWVTVVCFVIGYAAAFALARAGTFVQIVMLVFIRIVIRSHCYPPNRWLVVIIVIGAAFCRP